jgi:oligoendopeptidase F
MTDTTIPLRNAIAREHTWNAESVFPSIEAWEAEAQALPEAIQSLSAFHGRLAEGPETLGQALDTLETLFRRVMKVLTYAIMSHNVDTTDQAAARRFGQAQGLIGMLLGNAGFLDPDLLAIGREQLDAWLAAAPRLAVMGHYVDDLFRRQAHVRSAEVEQLLGMLADPFLGPRATANYLTNADLSYRPARASDGTEIPMSQAAWDHLRTGTDREARRTAWESYMDGHLAFKNTLASNLTTSIKQNIFYTRARGYESSLAGSLFENNIPVAVFHNLIDTFRKNVPTWHRYWAVRRKALGVDRLHPYDIWAPLTTAQPKVPYTQAVDWICAGLAPLGDEYVGVLRRGCLEDRWVDIYPNQGKTDGAFSSGSPETHPFILMSYNDTLFSLSTLAHELGHSLHSYYTWKHQPFVYANYSLFVAEVASNFNQAMVRAYLLDPAGGRADREFQIAVLEEALANFHRYFFIMPTLARFELETHQRVEKGRGLNATDMNELMADLFAEGYGDAVHVDRPRVGITWSTFSHMYADYYVYQYATGIAGAHALAHRILDGVPGAAEAYIDFLRAGSSLYPLEALQRAGVDLTTPAPVEAAFAVLAGMVDRLEALFA